jgi:hypothetical protein
VTACSSGGTNPARNLRGRLHLDGVRLPCRVDSAQHGDYPSSHVQRALDETGTTHCDEHLGFTVAQSTVAKYMAKPGDGRSGQSWGTFLRNHLPHIVAMDLFVVPTMTFVQLYVLVIVRLARRELVWVNVTAHPTVNGSHSKSPRPFPGTRPHAT